MAESRKRFSGRAVRNILPVPRDLQLPPTKRDQPAFRGERRRGTSVANRPHALLRAQGRGPCRVAGWRLSGVSGLAAGSWSEGSGSRAGQQGPPTAPARRVSSVRAPKVRWLGVDACSPGRFGKLELIGLQQQYGEHHRPT